MPPMRMANPMATGEDVTPRAGPTTFSAACRDCSVLARDGGSESHARSHGGLRWRVGPPRRYGRFGFTGHVASNT
jgi:hypothetical protein